MKNMIKMFGIIAFIALIGFMMAACGNPGVPSAEGGEYINGNGNNGNGNIGGATIKISGTPKLMMKLIATSGSNFSGNYEWNYASSANPLGWLPLSLYEDYHNGVNRSEFTIPIENPDLLGKYIVATRRNHMTNDYILSNIIGPIQLADNAAIAIKGITQLGMKINAKSDPNFTGNYKWFFSSDPNSFVWTELIGLQNYTYGLINRNELTIPATDLNGTSLVGMYIMAKRLHNNIEEIGSNILGPIQPDNGSMVIISGVPRMGMTIIATSGNNFSGNYEWNYASSVDAVGWLPLSLSFYDDYHNGVNRSEFTIPIEDPELLGKYIVAIRRNHMTNNYIWSNIIGQIQPTNW